MVPTLIQEPGAGAKPVELKREELAAVPRHVVLTDEELRTIDRIGDNTGCMALKGATPDHEGPEAPDRWPLSDELAELARRWRIDPDAQLRKAA